MAEVTKAFDDAQKRYADEFGWPQCAACKHSRDDSTCDAFPDAIPLEILAGEHDHRQPFPGDQGIRFEPFSELASA